MNDPRDFVSATLEGIVAPDGEEFLVLRVRDDDGVVRGLPAKKESTMRVLGLMFPTGGYSDRRIRYRTNGEGEVDALMYGEEEE